MKKFILGIALLFSSFAIGQPSDVVEFDRQIIPSEYFTDENPAYSICRIDRLDQVVDVGTAYEGGQCLKRNPGNTEWVGGACGAGGGSGVDFDAAEADPTEDLKFFVQEKTHTSLTGFVTGACVTGWGPNCWSRESRAIIGSYTGTAPPSDVVLISNTRLAYSTSNSKRVKNIWIGSTEYSVNWLVQTATLGLREVVYSTISPNLPGTNWQNVKLEFTDGTFSPATSGSATNATLTKQGLLSFLDYEEFAPTKENLFTPIEGVLKAGSNITITPNTSTNELTIASTASGGASSFTGLSDTPDDYTGSAGKWLKVNTGATALEFTDAPMGGSGGQAGPFLALESAPTDLSTFQDNQVIRVNTPLPGKWFEIQDKTAFGHGVKLVRGASGVNRGASLTGTSKYGAIQTEEGVPFDLQDAPVGRIEEESDDDNLVVYFRKSALSATDQARDVIYVRSYSGTPSSSNEVDTNALVKQADQTSDGIVWQVYFSGTSGPPARAFDGAWPDNAQNIYFRFFVSSPPTDNNSETLDFQEERVLEEIDPPYVPHGRASLFSRGTQLPTTDLQAGDVFLLDENGMHNLYIYSGPETRNAIITAAPSSKIDSNIPWSDTGGPVYRGIKLLSDDDYIYVVYMSQSNSYSSTPQSSGRYLFLRRWSISTGTEDVPWRSFFTLPTTDSLSSLALQNNWIYLRVSSQSSPYRKDVNANTPLALISINTQFGNAGNSLSVLNVGRKIRVSGTVSNVAKVVDFEVNSQGVLENGVTVDATKSFYGQGGQYFTHGNRGYIANTATGNLLAYNLNDGATAYARVPADDINIGNLFPTGLFGFAWTLANNRIYTVYSLKTFARQYWQTNNLDARGDIFAFNFTTGGWAKATDNVTFPNSSIISTGATAPRNNVGQEGHLYWDTAASNLYVKSGGTWHLVTGASGAAPTFLNLPDTPSSYTDQKGKISRVKNDETGLFSLTTLKKLRLM